MTEMPREATRTPQKEDIVTGKSRVQKEQYVTSELQPLSVDA